MTQEEKQLLLKDLCGRLPYGVICDRLGQAKKLLSVSPYKVYCLEFDNGEYMPGEYKVEDIKPFLRPMSSMTEEEKSEWYSFMEKYHGIPDDTVHIQRINDYQDWLNTHHFDHRGLIPMGLALEAKEGMYEG